MTRTAISPRLATRIFLNIMSEQCRRERPARARSARNSSLIVARHHSAGRLALAFCRQSPRLLVLAARRAGCPPDSRRDAGATLFVQKYESLFCFRRGFRELKLPTSYLLGMVIPLAPGCFSALIFLVVMVLSTHSSAVFRSAARAAGSSHSRSPFSRYSRFR